MTTRIELNNPALLTWARDRAGLTTTAMAAKLRVKAQQVVAWESGISLPTHRQVKEYARLGRTNVPTLFLPEVPDPAAPQTFGLDDWEITGYPDSCEVSLHKLGSMNYILTANEATAIGTYLLRAAEIADPEEDAP